MPDHPQPPFPTALFRSGNGGIRLRPFAEQARETTAPDAPSRVRLAVSAARKFAARPPGERPAAGTYGAKRTHSDMPPANRLRPSRRNDDLQFFTLNFLHRHRVLRPEEGGPIRQGRSSDSFPLHAFPPRRGSGSKSAQSMTELTATGIVPDSHRRSLLIPGRQPPAENLARNKSRKYPAGGPTTAPVLINNLSTKRRNPGATHAAGGNGHRPPQRETPEPLRGKDSSRHERKHTPP